MKSYPSIICHQHFSSFHNNILDKNKSRKQQWHNFTFKDINSRPIISSIKFHISFSLPIFYIFPLTTNNNHNKTNKTLTTATSNLEHHHFSLHNFSSDYLFIFCFSWCCALMKTNSELSTFIILFSEVEWVVIPVLVFHHCFCHVILYYCSFYFRLFSAILFLFLILLLFIVLFLTLLFYFRAVTLF